MPETVAGAQEGISSILNVNLEEESELKEQLHDRVSVGREL